MIRVRWTAERRMSARTLTRTGDRRFIFDE